ncbi:MAG: 3-hydroxyacyl-CoA dehydrogenase NAD-binding domain-containing protein [Gammaproteobacteria bacterium]
MNIEKVAVVGAGVMGAGIAAHIANAGVPVYLLDIVPENSRRRNAVAEAAIERLRKSEPAALMHPKNARLITPGNIEDHLDKLAGVDWIIEAVIEDLTVKQDLYRQLERVCSPETLISSNTSTLPLRWLTQKMSEAFKRRFMITHFFNPPRYMRLLELVAGEALAPDWLDAVLEFADRRLGKGCVLCKDTPGFIANRIGSYWLQSGLLEAIELELTVEQSDMLISKPFGIPKTGLFGLLDLIGLDLIPHILEGFDRMLPEDDPFRQINRTPELMQRMIADGYTGRKGKGGFYRLRNQDGKRVKEAIDLVNGAYRPCVKPDPGAFEGELQALLSREDKFGRFAWRVMAKTLNYAAGLVPEIADDIVAIDTAMKLGYNWRYGPFELLDRIGVAWFIERLQSENLPVPPLLEFAEPLYKSESGKLQFADLSGRYNPVPRAPDTLLLADIKLQGPPLLTNASASLWDIGDGIACLEFHSKMNTLNMETMTLIRQGIDRVRQGFSALVIYNEAEHFSAGANLHLLMSAIASHDWSCIEDFLRQGQQTYLALKYAPFPVVGAPAGLALGGGCEILLHCDAIQAHAELYTGLVEVGVGVVPGWGGCKEYLRRQLQNPKRFGGPIPPVKQAFETIGMAKVSKSAFEAKELLFLAPGDGITMNRERLLADAKAKASALVTDYQPPESWQYRLPGKTGQILFGMAAMTLHWLGKATAYDVEVGKRLAFVLCGGDTDHTEELSEAEVLELERNAFMQLVKRPETTARLEHMLKTGKPLRN